MEKNQKNNIEIEVRSIVSDLAIRQLEDGKPSRVITGYASKFDTWSEPIYGWFVEKIARQNHRVFPGELVFIFEKE